MSNAASSAARSRRRFLQGALGLPALGLAARRAQAKQPRERLPSIVLLLVDDWGWADLGAYGSTLYETPHLDKIAAEGVRFTNAYASCPVCSPSRAALMTGKVPPRLGITDWIPGRKQHPFSPVIMPEDSDHLPLEETTIAEVLKPLGYATASIGKWHLGGEGFGPVQQGFDVNVAGTFRGSPPSYFAPYKAELPGIANPPDGEFLTERLCQEAEKFLEENRGKPFFLYLSEFAVHTPLQAERDVIEKYAAKGSLLDHQHNATYAAMVESVDDTVGRVRAKLATLGLEKDTVIFITSDNGGLLYEGKSRTPVTSNRPLRAGKGHLYEGGVRVPLIVFDPRAKARVEDDPVAGIDILPTIAAYAGVSVPPGIDGVSLYDLVRNAKRTAPRALYWHYPHYSNQGGYPGGSIREGDWKLIENYENGALELYNLRADIREEKNLAFEQAAKARELNAKLIAWRERVGAKMPAKNPGYDPTKADQELTGSRRENQ